MFAHVLGPWVLLTCEEEWTFVNVLYTRRGDALELHCCFFGFSFRLVLEIPRIIYHSVLPDFVVAVARWSRTVWAAGHTRE